MDFLSTRNKEVKVKSSRAIFEGLSREGGLYVPGSFPKISQDDMEEMLDMSYEEKAAFILGKYLTDFSAEELEAFTDEAYADFEEGNPAPLVMVDSSTAMLELWHGPTCAFKDMALRLLPHLVLASAKAQKIKEKPLLMVATSGDTGKAALDAFAAVPETKVIVFYPTDGISNVQKLMMTTQEGDNVAAAGVKGNFDDCQKKVKELFRDPAFNLEVKKAGYFLTSANSINLGRLLPQIVYYFSAYLDLAAGEEICIGDKVNFAVPTGNFGNILAGYYACKMGLPANKFICASNSNNVLTDFFKTGVYDANRIFYKTKSPAMDILVSSNLERLIFEISGRDDNLTAERMDSLAKAGKYSITPKELAALKKIFYAAYVDDAQTLDALNNFFSGNDYLCDPHTATAICAYNEYLVETEDDETPVIILCTAHPYKFAGDVLAAIEPDAEADNDIECMNILKELSAMERPEEILSALRSEPKHTDVIERSEIGDYTLKFIK